MIDFGLKIGLIITAGGSSQRFGRNKLMVNLFGQPVILRTFDAFCNLNLSQVVLTASSEFIDDYRKLFNKRKHTNLKIIEGGKNRQESVYKGLSQIDPDTDFVIIHDGARPLIDEGSIVNCIKLAVEKKAGIVAVDAIDTIKIVDNSGKIMSTPNRETLRYVQTPQVFDYKLIKDAHERLKGENFSDDAGLLEALGVPVYVSKGVYSNIKITNPEDILIAESFLKNKTSNK